MKVKFWGTRGSIPTPISPAAIEDKIRQALLGVAGFDLSSTEAVERYVQRLPLDLRRTVGGNTACVEVRAGDQLLVLDAGSGLRLLGCELMRSEFATGHGAVDFLVSHTHWDHIQGLPFFAPAFVPGNRLTFRSPHAHLEAAFTGQQIEMYFPVSLSHLRADIEFERVAARAWSQIGGLRIYPLRMSHPGESYSYRIEHDGTSLVYATDSEFPHMHATHTRTFVEFFHDADLLIFDAQYSLNEALDKSDWGHSSPMVGAELAHRAGVRRLALFHHDPMADDRAIYAGLRQAEAYLAQRGSRCQVMIAAEDMEVIW